VLFSAIIKEGDILPGNSLFDTTKRPIEYRKAFPVDCTIDEASDSQLEIPFKGNVDLNKLEAVFKKYPKERIPAVVLTITNNTAGGQPVSMENIRQTSFLCQKYGMPLLIDSARFAENAYFIKIREKRYENKTIRVIVKEIFSLGEFSTPTTSKLICPGFKLALLSKKGWYTSYTAFKIAFASNMEQFMPA